jgi:hypothetical protein
MRVTKEHPASQAYGRGSDNYRAPAAYAVLNAKGAKVGIILGTHARHFEKTHWTVYWLSPEAIPRTVYNAKSFADAKGFAERWDGQAPEPWRVTGGSR